MALQLRSHQISALEKMRNGCILNGTVGSGKSLTALCYYYKINNGNIGNGIHKLMKNPCDLYIITTARKRDTMEWEEELIKIYMPAFGDGKSPSPYSKVKVVIDSWNNVGKYKDVKNAFFIFDEQRVVGYGAWVKAFLKIAKENKWILLTATPGDCWMDYVPVFIANGFYKNKTDFVKQHVVFCAFLNFPKIDHYINEGKLMKLRQYILINMDFKRTTIPHHFRITCAYDEIMYSDISKNRWNIYKGAPIVNASEYCLCLRKLVNSDPSRCVAIADILKDHPKAIIFYNYDYELEILRNLFKDRYPYAEWNGHNHENILTGEKWVYLVQYTAGNEGWNCITCDTMIFYSQSYSYKVMLQACGRIDRLNTPFTHLYYYHLKSNSKIDGAINKALNKKKKFNEKGFAPDFCEQKEKLK